jgi:hypothetical protein
VAPVFLIWRGRGLLLVVYVIAGTIGLGIIAGEILGSDAYIDSPLFPGLGLLVAGVLSVVTGRRLNGAPIPYLARDVPKDGEVFRPRVPFFFAQHNFFFIPLEAWGALLVSISVFDIVRSLIQSLAP